MSPSNNTNPIEGAAQLATTTTTASGDHGATSTATTTASSTNTTGVGGSPPPLSRANAALTTPSPSHTAAQSPTNSNVVDSSPSDSTTDETPNGSDGNEDDTTEDIFAGLDEQRRREWDLVKLTKIVPRKSKGGAPSAVYNYMYKVEINQDKVRWLLNVCIVI